MSRWLAAVATVLLALHPSASLADGVRVGEPLQSVIRPIYIGPSPNWTGTIPSVNRCITFGNVLHPTAVATCTNAPNHWRMERGFNIRYVQASMEGAFLGGASCRLDLVKNGVTIVATLQIPPSETTLLPGAVVRVDVSARINVGETLGWQIGDGAFAPDGVSTPACPNSTIGFSLVAVGAPVP